MILNTITVVSVSATYSMYNIGTKTLFKCDGTSAGFTITLPDATLFTGCLCYIVKIDASGNAITVGTTSSQTILDTAGAATTKSLAAQGNKITVVSDGSNWIAV